MLAGLLDPFAPHGLNKLFLAKFLRLIAGPKFPVSGAEALNSNWMIEREHHVPGGRIDILLLCPAQRVAVAIENKIDAGESKLQLSCYSRWLTSLGPYFTTGRLVFLTLRGVAPKGVSPDGCTCISYSQILQILLECLSEVEVFDPALRTYANTLARLTGSALPE